MREYDTIFANHEAALNHVERLRWPNGVTCPACGETKRIQARNGDIYQCNACRERGVLSGGFSVRTGTVLERTKVPMNKWLSAIRALLGDAGLVYTSVGLGAHIGVSQKTAWLMTRRLNEAADPDALGRSITGLDQALLKILAYRPARKGKAAKRGAVRAEILRAADAATRGPE